MTIDATTALGNDTIRPASAAVSPHSSVLGPMATRSDAPDSVAMRMTASAERKPLMAHTAVDTDFGLMPVRRASSGLADDARTDSPNAVWPRPHQSATVTSGTMHNAMSWPGPRTTLPGRCHVVENGVGKAAESEPVRYSGSASVIACA